MDDDDFIIDDHDISLDKTVSKIELGKEQDQEVGSQSLQENEEQEVATNDINAEGDPEKVFVGDTNKSTSGEEDEACSSTINVGSDGDLLMNKEEIEKIEYREEVPTTQTTSSQEGESENRKKKIEKKVTFELDKPKCYLCSDTVLNDGLLELQLLMCLKASFMLTFSWASSPSIQRRLIKHGFPEEKVMQMQNLVEKDTEDAIVQLLSYLSFHLNQKSDVIVPLCEVVIRVRKESLCMEATQIGIDLPKGDTKFETEEGFQVMGFCFDVLSTLVSSTTSDFSTERNKSVTNLTNLAFQFFVDHHQKSENDDDEFELGLKTSNFIQQLSRFSLPQTLNNFSQRMSKVYFQQSALDFVPFMKICSSGMGYSLSSKELKIACKEFLTSIHKVLKITACSELIEECFRTVIYIMECFMAEIFKASAADEDNYIGDYNDEDDMYVENDDQHHHDDDDEEEDDDDLETDMSDCLESLFTMGYYYASRKKYVGVSLNAMEAIISFEEHSGKFYGSLPNQHDRLCSEILTRIDSAESRISGLDHLQRYLKSLPISTARSTRGRNRKKQELMRRKMSHQDMMSRLDGLPNKLFPTDAVPRAQEIALITSVVSEIGKRQFGSLLDDMIVRGLKWPRASSAQRSICLHGLAKTGLYMEESASRKELQTFQKKYSKFAIYFSTREHPAEVVAGALSCYPILGETNPSILHQCVENAFGFDFTLVDAGRNALIRCCKMDPLFAEKAIMGLMESPSLRLICTYQKDPKERQDTNQILSSVQTLHAVLSSAVVDSGFNSIDLITEAGSTFILASTYPDQNVKDTALGALKMLEKYGDSIKFRKRAVDRVIVGLLGNSMGDSCGGSICLQIAKHLSREKGFGNALHWWQTQCTLVCASPFESHSNKPTFVKALVQEYISAKDPYLLRSGLQALTYLRDLHEIVDKQVELLAIRGRNECFNLKLIQLFCCFSHSYKNGALEDRITRVVSTWIKVWSTDEARRAMYKWPGPVLESAAQLLESFIKNGELNMFESPDLMRDQCMFLIREWCKSTKKEGELLPKVSDAFVAVLDSGQLKTVEAQTFAMKMLAAFSGSKGYQANGLKYLLNQNLDEMIGHYFEAVLWSFDPKRWSTPSVEGIVNNNNNNNSALSTKSGGMNSSIKGGGGASIINPNHLVSANGKGTFIIHVTKAVLECVDDNDDSLDPQMVSQLLLVICLLFVHPIVEIRVIVSQWCQNSRFLGLPNPNFGPAYFSGKLDGVRKSIFLSRYLSTENKTCAVDDIFAAALKISQYLNNQQVSYMIRIMKPWVESCFPQTSKNPKYIVTTLLRLCMRLSESRTEPAWTIWQSIDLNNRFEETLEGIIEWILDHRGGKAEKRAALNAMNYLSSKVEQGKGNNILKPLVNAFPPLSWQAPKITELDILEEKTLKRSPSIDSTSSTSSTANNQSNGGRDRKALRIRAIIQLITNAPFFLYNADDHDVAKTLYYIFIEEGMESQLSKIALQSIIEEITPIQQSITNTKKTIENSKFSSSAGESDQDNNNNNNFKRRGSVSSPTSIPSTRVDQHPGKITEALKAINGYCSSAIAFFEQQACHCILYCSNPLKRTRAFLVLQNIGLNDLTIGIKRELIQRICFRCCQECNLLSRQKLVKPQDVEQMGHALVLLELIAEGFSSNNNNNNETENLVGQLERDCVKIALSILSLPIVSRENVLFRSKISALKILSFTRPNIINEEMQSIAMHDIIHSLVHEDTSVLGSKVIHLLQAEDIKMQGMIYVIFVGAISCLAQDQSLNSATAPMISSLHGKQNNRKNQKASRPRRGSAFAIEIEQKAKFCKELFDQVLSVEVDKSTNDMAFEKRRTMVDQVLAYCDKELYLTQKSMNNNSNNLEANKQNLNNGSMLISNMVMGFLRTQPFPNEEELFGLLNFLSTIIKYGQLEWGIPSMRILAEFLKHKEVIETCTNGNVLDDIIQTISRSLETWPNQTHTILQIMSQLPTKQKLSFTFMQAKTMEQQESIKALRLGLQNCFSKLTELYTNNEF